MRTRYRIGTEGTFFKKQVLVLQIYKHIPEGPPDSYGNSGYQAHEAWVDATPEDITVCDEVKP